MSAPNKIYVSADPFGFMHAYDAENYPSDGEAYIRKDYLLELIEEEAKFWDDGEMIFRKFKKELNEI